MASDRGPFYRQLGAGIRRAREGAGMTQEMLAHVLGLARTSVANIESGRQPVLAHSLVLIASAVGVAPADLLPSPEKITEPSAKEHIRKLPPEQKKWVEQILGRKLMEAGHEPATPIRARPRKGT